MIRHCIITATAAQAVQKADGSWSVEGLGADLVLLSLNAAQEMSRPFNSSFYLTTQASECLARISSNQSDVTNVLMPIETLSNYYHAPQPLFAGKVQFLTGYSSSESAKEAEMATVASNIDLLDTDVYAWALFLLLSFVLVIILRVSIYWRRSIFHRTSIFRKILKELARVFYYSSQHFRAITILYAILCFYMVTSFLCLYKTSHVIVEKPFYPKSYQESLDHKTSLAHYYDQYAVVSHAFRTAPPGSLKGKLWAKLVASGRRDEYNATKFHPGNILGVLKKGSDEMTVLKGICLAVSLTMPLLRSLACSLSSEKELWIIKVASDPSELEMVYGYTVSTTSRFSPFFAKQQRRLFEMHVIAHQFTMLLDFGDMASELMSTSKNHRWKQKVACDDPDAFTTDIHVEAIPLYYFRSFLIACCYIWFLAFLLNTLQIICSKRRKASRSRFTVGHRANRR